MIFAGVLLLVCFLAVASLIFYATTKMRRTEDALPDSREAESQETIRDSSESVISANASVRQKQQEDIRRRMMTGKCLHCDNPATHASPRWTLVQPMLSGFYRYLGVIPIDHWTMETHVRNDRDKSLCQWHHHESVAIMQEKDGELSQEYAKLTREARAKRLEFETFVLYEEMTASREGMYARGGKKKGTRMAPVTPIRREKNAG